MAPRAAGVIVTRTASEPEFLLLRAYNYWDFPKGELVGEESLRAAALRELREETGLASTELTFPWGDTCFATAPYRQGKVAHYFLARVATTAAITLAPNSALARAEHHEYRWTNYAAARRLLVPRLQYILDQAHRLIENEADG